MYPICRCCCCGCYSYGCHDLNILFPGTLNPRTQLLGSKRPEIAPQYTGITVQLGILSKAMCSEGGRVEGKTEAQCQSTLRNRKSRSVGRSAAQLFPLYQNCFAESNMHRDNDESDPPNSASLHFYRNCTKRLIES